MSINTVKKSRGRPRVDSEAITVRLVRDDISRLDHWIEEHPDTPTRPEAIRQLMRDALASKHK